MNEKENEERLEKIEALLIEQEHRFLTVLNNFFIKRPKWPSDDPRRAASAKALIWALFFSPGTVAVAGTTVALVIVGVFVWQNLLIKKQNEFFQTQIKQQQSQIESQDNIFIQTERTKLLQIIYGSEFNNNLRIKREAVKTFVLLERDRLAKEKPKYYSSGTVIISYVDLSNADLKNIEIDNFDLSKVNFFESNLTNASLQGADLTSANLLDSDLTSANLLDSDLTSANLLDSDLTSANLLDSDLTNTILQGANLTNARLEGADLTSTALPNADLISANLTGANLTNTLLVSADLTNASLQDANLTKARLLGADLTNARLQVANLTSADLRLADLTDAYLWGADLTNVDLEKANLTNAVLWVANLKDIRNWRKIKSIKGANIRNVKNPPEGFIEWALENGAVIDPPYEETQEEDTESGNDPFQAPKNQ